MQEIEMGSDRASNPPFSSAIREFQREFVSTSPARDAASMDELSSAERWELFTRFHRYLDWKEARTQDAAADEGLRLEAARLALEPLEDEAREQSELLMATAENDAGNVDFQVKGPSFWVEPAVAAVVREFLLHGWRNALAHGFAETSLVPQGERSAFNPRIVLEFGMVGDRLQARLSDNGQGADWDRIIGEYFGRTGKKIDRSTLTTESALDLICSPFVSSASEQSLAAGSGWGLMGLLSRLSDAGGELRLSPRSLLAGEGFSLIAEIPLRTLGANCAFENGRLVPSGSGRLRFFHRVSPAWFPVLLESTTPVTSPAAGALEMAALCEGELVLLGDCSLSE